MTTGNLKLIVAHSQNRVIGKDGGIPWKISQDMALFKALTQGGTVIMGRKTFDSIERKGLPLRHNVVISSDLPPAYFDSGVPYFAKDVEIMRCPYEAFHKYPHAWVIGGEGIYKAALKTNQVEVVYATIVNGAYEGDTRFPKLDGWEGFMYLRRPECEFWAFRPQGTTVWQPAGPIKVPCGPWLEGPITTSLSPA